MNTRIQVKMPYTESLTQILVKGPTPAASAAALTVLLDLTQHGDFAAARALAAELGNSLGYDDAASKILEATTPDNLLSEHVVPPLLRIYLIGLSPSLFLKKCEHCFSLAEEVRASDDFRRFQRLVLRDDILQHEGLKAYVLTALAIVMKSFSDNIIPASFIVRILDQILTKTRIVPGSAVDSGFLFGRDKILAINLKGIIGILLHELGHHIFELGMTGDFNEFAETIHNSDSVTNNAVPTPADVVELMSALPGLVAGAQTMEHSGPQRIILRSGLSFLMSIICKLPTEPYIHMSLTDHGAPITRESAGDHAFLILKLIDADPKEAAAAMSPRGVFHFGIRGRGPDEPELKRRLNALDPAVLLLSLREQSAAWLNQLEASGLLTNNADDIQVGLGLIPPEPRLCPADQTVWEDLSICGELRSGSSDARLLLKDFSRVVTAAIGAGDDELLRALLTAAGPDCRLSHEFIAIAGSSLGVIDDRKGTKQYYGSTPGRIIAVLKTLMDHGCDLDYPIDERGSTLLIAAARRSPQAASALIALGVDVNHADARNETPLHAAATSGYNDLAKELIAAGASVDVPNADGVTPLMEAVQQDHTSVAAVLLDHGANPNAADCHGVTALMTVSSTDLAACLIKAGATPNARDNSGASALMYSAGNGLPAIVRTLLNAGADPEAAADQGDTALHRAAFRLDEPEQQECFSALLECGVDVDEETATGITPLMVASREGLPDALHYLLARGANVNARSTTGNTALIFACDPSNQYSRSFNRQERTNEVVRLLAAAKADLNSADDDGVTALHLATHFFDSTLIKILLELGANPNVRTQSGETPLMSAAAKRHPDVVNVLLDAGADVNMRDIAGNTALAYIIRDELSQDNDAVNITTITEALLNHGADPGLRNVAGESLASLIVNRPFPNDIKARIAAVAHEKES